MFHVNYLLKKEMVVGGGGEKEAGNQLQLYGQCSCEILVKTFCTIMVDASHIMVAPSPILRLAPSGVFSKHCDW